MGRFVLSLLALVCLAASAQTSTSSNAKFGPLWHSLAGAWTSEASAGVGAGACAFHFELGDQILVRTNHAEVPAVGSRPGGAHDDLMIISPGSNENQGHATYWDNEGHIIEYSATWSADGDSLTFLSKPGSGPQFRLLYKKVNSDTFSVSFDLARS